MKQSNFSEKFSWITIRDFINKDFKNDLRVYNAWGGSKKIVFNEFHTIDKKRSYLGKILIWQELLRRFFTSIQDGEIKWCLLSLILTENIKNIRYMLVDADHREPELEMRFESIPHFVMSMVTFLYFKGRFSTALLMQIKFCKSCKEAMIAPTPRKTFCSDRCRMRQYRKQD